MLAEQFCLNHPEVGAPPAVVVVHELGEEPRPLCAECVAELPPEPPWRVAVPISGVCPHRRCVWCAKDAECCRCKLAGTVVEDRNSEG